MTQDARSAAGGEPGTFYFDLLRHFTWASLGVILAASLCAGVGSAWLVHRTFVQIEREEADNLAENMVTFLAEEGYGHALWLASEPVPDELRARLRARLDNLAVSEFSLLAPDGTVLADFGHERDKSWPIWDPGMRGALAGRAAIHWERPRALPLVLFDPSPPGEIETYSPVRERGAIVAAARMRRNLSPVLARAHAMSLRFMILAGLGGVAVFVALWLLVRRADRRLRSQDRVIEETWGELELRNRLLEELNRGKDEFYAMCSTDLRAPLRAVRAATRALLDEPAERLPAEQRLVVGEIDRNAETVLDLLDNLLDLARLESGEGQPVKQTVDVAAELSAVVSAHAVLAEGMRARVRLSGPPNARLDGVDRSKLVRALGTLLAHVIARGRDSEVNVVLETGRSGIRVFFTDRGPAIPPGELATLFDADMRLPADSAARHLPLVRELLDSQGGTISVAAEPGGATKFTVTLNRPRAA